MRFGFHGDRFVVTCALLALAALTPRHVHAWPVVGQRLKKLQHKTTPYPFVVNRETRQALSEAVNDIVATGGTVKIERHEESLVVLEEGFDLLERFQIWPFARSLPANRHFNDAKFAMLSWTNGQQRTLTMGAGSGAPKFEIIDEIDPTLLYAKQKDNFYAISAVDPRRISKPATKRPSLLGRALVFEGKKGPFIAFKGNPSRSLDVVDTPKMLGKNHLLAEVRAPLPMDYRNQGPKNRETAFILLSMAEGMYAKSPLLATSDVKDEGTAFRGFLHEGDPDKQNRWAILIDKEYPSVVSEWFRELESLNSDWWLAKWMDRAFYIPKVNVSQKVPSYMGQGVPISREDLWQIPVGDARAFVPTEPGTFIFVDKTDTTVESAPFGGSPTDRGDHWEVHDIQGRAFKIWKDDITRPSEGIALTEVPGG